MIKKLKQTSGETLVEALVSLLIAVLSMAMLCSAVLAANKINEDLRKEDEIFSKELQQAEGLSGTQATGVLLVKFYTEDGVEIKDVTDESRPYTEVILYQSENGTFFSYDYDMGEDEP